jgi:phospholipid/cholesterol/gamma-HCH transport system substrate-binding protein
VPNIKDGVNRPLGKDRAAPMIDMSSGYAGTQDERRVVNALAAPVLGVPADHVPDVGTLLFAPLARGTEVSVR